MQFIYTFIGGIIITLLSLPALAWQVNLPAHNETEPQQIEITNNQPLKQVEVYLVWFDMDISSQSESFLSWRFEQGWQPGLTPVFSQPQDLPTFESYTLHFEQPTCPPKHRCLLALVATQPEQDPVDARFWQASSFLPLSVPASCERFPGQQFFLSCDDNPIELDFAPEKASIPTAANLESSESDQSVEVEKPDILKLVGTQLVYANGAAQRFQVIDISDLTNPRLVSWSALSGNPRELYVRDNLYLLLQSDYTSEEGTHLTVLRQESDNSLTLVQELNLPGYFVESRRRNQFIYVVTQQTTFVEELNCPQCSFSQQSVNIKVLIWGESGQLELVDEEKLSGYSPTVAIFQDYLVLANHNPQEENWRTTQIQVFDLSNEDPLISLPLLTVPGQIPSEFHLNVLDQQLRVVYGPENREAGSTLAIYDLTSLANQEPIGKVSQIAPGEALFATRFEGNRAFVVTFERTDPLWVIDLTDPSSPKILGELEVPGWSEKLFFHEDRLFAVGINNQPLEQEEKPWVRRVALSLFDVANPIQPTLIKRFIPLADKVSYSWSPALDDERALLLNWNEVFAALPINSSETEAGSHLQVVSLANDTIEDIGYIDSTVPLQRSVTVAPETLATLGDQILLTLRWEAGELPSPPKLLGELELATNLTWLKHQEGNLWVAARGNKGYHRFYHYIPTDLEVPQQRWNLPQSYGGVVMDKQLVVFYNYNPLAIQVLDVNNGLLQARVLEENITKPNKEVLEPTEPVVAADTLIAPHPWYQRSQPLLHDGWFYLAEQQPFQPAPNQNLQLPVPEQENWQPQWVLRSWNVQSEDAKEAPSRSIPGQPVAFMANGELITQETTPKGQLRLNRLGLDIGQAKLLYSQELPCQNYSQVIMVDGIIYMNCMKEYRYGPVPVFKAEEAIGDKEEPIEQPEQDPTTQILKLNPGQNFAEEGNWTLAGMWDLLTAASETIMVRPSWSWDYPIATLEEPAVLESQTRRLPLYPNENCEIYRVVSGQAPQSLKKVEPCFVYGETVTLTPEKAWIARGFAGLQEVSW